MKFEPKSWADIEQRALICPICYRMVTLVRVGHYTKEAALQEVVIALLDERDGRVQAEINKLKNLPAMQFAVRMGLDRERNMERRAVDALLGKTWDAVLPCGTAALVRLSSIDPDRKTAVLFVEHPNVDPKRRVYDLDTFYRLIREEWIW